MLLPQTLRRHRFFHEQAAAMLMHLDNREQAKAEQAFKGCQHSSRQVVLLLRSASAALACGVLRPQPRWSNSTIR